MAPGSDGARADGSTTDGMVVKPDADAGLSAWLPDDAGRRGRRRLLLHGLRRRVIPRRWQRTCGVDGHYQRSRCRDAHLRRRRCLLARSTSTSASNGTAGAHTRLLKILVGADAHKYLHYELQYDFCVLNSSLQYGAVGPAGVRSTSRSHPRRSTVSRHTDRVRRHPLAAGRHRRIGEAVPPMT